MSRAIASINVLVAPDIAAWSIDVDGISHVINYDVPDIAEAYIHRTGRTGRAARTGDVLTFATREDNRLIRLNEQSMDNRMSSLEVASLPQPYSADCAIPVDGAKAQAADAKKWK